jgi:hypothetical protein
MPYIKQFDRHLINIQDVGAFIPENAGELQYVIATMIDNYHRAKGFNYQMANNIMGALTGALQEYYAVVVSPYEQKKLEENGPVYDPDSYPVPELY